MTEMTVREVQLSCLEILKAFDAFCREHELCYFLSGGTLLGAVRHKGFIPWDDDVDVMMPRRDYEKLKSFGDEWNGSHYALFYSGGAVFYNRPWARLTDITGKRTVEHQFEGEEFGTYIDIFPVDGMPETKTGMRIHYFRMRFLDILNRSAKRKFTYGNERLAVLKKILRAVLKHFGAARFALAMDRMAKRYDFDSCRTRGVAVVLIHGLRERMDAGVFAGSVPVEFEGCQLPAPAGWDTYLRALYGDYMKIPKEHENDTGNSFTHRSRYAAAGSQEVGQ